MIKSFFISILCLWFFGLNANDSLMQQNALRTLKKSGDSAAYTIRQTQFKDGVLLEDFDFYWSILKDTEQIYYPDVIYIYQFGNKAIVEMPEDQLVLYYRGNYPKAASHPNAKNNKRLKEQLQNASTTEDSTRWEIINSNQIVLHIYTDLGVQNLWFSDSGNNLERIEIIETLPDNEDENDLEKMGVYKSVMVLGPLQANTLKHYNYWLKKEELQNGLIQKGYQLIKL